LQNEPKFVQAGVEKVILESQKRTQVQGAIDWQDGLFEGKTKPESGGGGDVHPWKTGAQQGLRFTAPISELG
jgi:hypothetical protein